MAIVNYRDVGGLVRDENDEDFLNGGYLFDPRHYVKKAVKKEGVRFFSGDPIITGTSSFEKDSEDAFLKSENLLNEDLFSEEARASPGSESFSGA